MSSTYNMAQWRESFEGQLSILRPHLSQRLLDSMSVSAWHARGSKGEDPIKAAKAVSGELDARAASKRP